LLEHGSTFYTLSTCKLHIGFAHPQGDEIIPFCSSFTLKFNFQTLTADLFGEDWLYNGILNVTKIWGRCDVDAFYGCYRDAANNMLNPILSAKLKSKFAFKYGKVEIVARMPQGDWIWPGEFHIATRSCMQ